jgi:argininosuccinate lyase
MFARDAERMGDVLRRTNRLPLGAAALAGTSYPLDRERVARTLGMVDDNGQACVCQNSLDAVSDRDFAIEFTAAATLCMIHFSRMSEELVLWMSQNFGFIDLADRFCTGSSIMPQKKNPDVAELARGKAGRLIGNLTGLLATLKGLPLAYNRDLQEDKEPIFDSVDQLLIVLPAVTGMVSTLTFDRDQLERLAPMGFSLATDIADWLVRRRVPFAEAHEIAGACVRRCEDAGIELKDLSADDLAEISPHLTSAVRSVLTVAGSVDSRSGRGGTAEARVREQLTEVDVDLAAVRKWLERD